jgi:hypothetical protein
MLKNYFTTVIYNVRNKLECLSLAGLSSSVHCLLGAAAYLGSIALLKGKLLALLTNIRLGWNGLPRTKALA